MIFEEVVKKAVEETSGGLAAVIMAKDGISLSQYIKPEGPGIDMETLGIEYANLLAEIIRASQAMDAGGVKEILLNTDKYLTILRVINPEYFIALICQPGANLGKGRFLLRANIPAILKEL